ncbi:MAG: bifunctional UDP-N-acetylglucosamine pyrophosphorylase / glucosamine-phosphate N-acetyltransferase [Actinomycetota bacterium]|jgi:bifunctional UDP-N-acetylglucosamine pyrophosphorylase/glucosamine-1-phosphate N-acetyltransferase|nr:bifunctional UDP-N-acetylglucosamine pyrophosphorylase / glucosamine-phosphate N-acetyltransferase [Actinomycetota bacterium]
MAEHPDVAAIVLAAGDGKRLRSDLPKVLHRVAGRPLLGHVLDALTPLGLGQVVIVASTRKDEIAAAMSGADAEYVVQDPPRGTGDAVRVALAVLSDSIRHVIVLAGDTPLISTGTIASMLARHAETSSAATMLTARIDDPTGYGRVVRGADGRIERVVEQRDATPDELVIDEINTGAFVFELGGLAKVLPKLGSDNSQQEYYLTDSISLLLGEGDSVSSFETTSREADGVNSRAQLAQAGAELRRQACERWMDEGVTIVDPNSTFIDATVTIERDAVIQPFTFLEGNTTVGQGAEVGPQARIIDSSIAAGATVTFAVVRGSTIGEGASVGPFASLRPGTVLERGARAGTFVETKQTTIGEDSKANHLSYLGDATIGKGVNVGAGTITCNWDGTEKHETVIDDDAYIGSDTMLVAPTHIGKRAATGAGSVVRGDVPDDALAVGVPARIIEGKGNKMGKDRGTPSQDPRG